MAQKSLAQDVEARRAELERDGMITEGPHRQQLRLLVDRLPDGVLDAAIAFLSKLTSEAPIMPTENVNDDPPTH